MIYRQCSNFSVTDGQKGRVFLNLAVIFGLLLMSIFYLIQTNKLVAKNFELRVWRGLMLEKQEYSQKLLISSMQSRSLNNLEITAKNLNLVTVDTINYLKATPGFFALSQRP